MSTLCDDFHHHFRNTVPFHKTYERDTYRESHTTFFRLPAEESPSFCQKICHRSIRKLSCLDLSFHFDSRTGHCHPTSTWRWSEPWSCLDAHCFDEITHFWLLIHKKKILGRLDVQSSWCVRSKVSTPLNWFCVEEILSIDSSSIFRWTCWNWFVSLFRRIVEYMLYFLKKSDSTRWTRNRRRSRSS